MMGIPVRAAAYLLNPSDPFEAWKAIRNELRDRGLRLEQISPYFPATKTKTKKYYPPDTYYRLKVFGHPTKLLETGTLAKCCVVALGVLGYGDENTVVWGKRDHPREGFLKGLQISVVDGKVVNHPPGGTFTEGVCLPKHKGKRKAAARMDAQSSAPKSYGRPPSP